ncbi:MAG: LCP family protein [Eubacterium sp.]|nr:LCP family protein [Eubacterium sp.]
MKFRRKDNATSKYRTGQREQKMMAAFGWLLSVAAFVAGGLVVLGVSGRYNLQRQAVSYAAGEKVMAVVTAAPHTERRQNMQEDDDGTDDIEYAYNDDLLTFLFMGIGEKQETDALFLLVLNPHEEKIKLIPIDPDTITAIDIYDEQGVYERTMTAAIGSQYGFGDGGKKSCEYQIGAVRNLFHGIAVNGYLAVDMNVLPDVAALVDGMEKETPQEVTAGGRMATQIYYMTEFISRVKQQSSTDFTIPVRIYNEISDRVVTDITVDEVVYLAASAGGYRFDTGQVAMIPGQSKNGTDGAYAGFYVDQNALQELILAIFYEPVS